MHRGWDEVKWEYEYCAVEDKESGSKEGFEGVDGVPAVRGASKETPVDEHAEVGEPQAGEAESVVEGVLGKGVLEKSEFSVFIVMEVGVESAFVPDVSDPFHVPFNFVILSCKITDYCKPSCQKLHTQILRK